MVYFVTKILLVTLLIFKFQLFVSCNRDQILRRRGFIVKCCGGESCYKIPSPSSTISTLKTPIQNDKTTKVYKPSVTTDKSTAPISSAVTSITPIVTSSDAVVNDATTSAEMYSVSDLSTLPSTNTTTIIKDTGTITNADQITTYADVVTTAKSITMEKTTTITTKASAPTTTTITTTTPAPTTTTITTTTSVPTTITSSTTTPAITTSTSTTQVPTTTTSTTTVTSTTSTTTATATTTSTTTTTTLTTTTTVTTVPPIQCLNSCNCSREVLLKLSGTITTTGVNAFSGIWEIVCSNQVLTISNYSYAPYNTLNNFKKSDFKCCTGFIKKLPTIAGIPSDIIWYHWENAYVEELINSKTDIKYTILNYTGNISPFENATVVLTLDTVNYCDSNLKYFGKTDSLCVLLNTWLTSKQSQNILVNFYALPINAIKTNHRNIQGFRTNSSYVYAGLPITPAEVLIGNVRSGSIRLKNLFLHEYYYLYNGTTNLLTYTLATEECKRLGMYLTVYSDGAEYDRIKNWFLVDGWFVYNSWQRNTWIGMIKINGVWVDPISGQQITYFDWNSGKPTGGAFYLVTMEYGLKGWCLSDLSEYLAYQRYLCKVSTNLAILYDTQF